VRTLLGWKKEGDDRTRETGLLQRGGLEIRNKLAEKKNLVGGNPSLDNQMLALAGKPQWEKKEGGDRAAIAASRAMDRKGVVTRAFYPYPRTEKKGDF